MKEEGRRRERTARKRGKGEERAYQQPGISFCIPQLGSSAPREKRGEERKCGRVKEWSNVKGEHGRREKETRAEKEVWGSRGQLTSCPSHGPRGRK